MNTIKQASNNTGIPETVIRAVVRRVSRESIPDIVNHGIDGGFGGFIYYSDTVAFFKRYRHQITDMVEEMADQLGEDPINMVASFGCLDDDRETRRSIARCLYGRCDWNEDTQVANALSWFAAEESARALYE